ncbi:hypothetical protein ACIRRA_45920, partial [Nocardia sp. NPDC101769]|uniref:hypothetical protein n=1 Tax=Nocardia sp. NPDC101769 TaxID=3364333 RepID=UPI0037FF3A61
SQSCPAARSRPQNINPNPNRPAHQPHERSGLSPLRAGFNIREKRTPQQALLGHDDAPANPGERLTTITDIARCRLG